MAVGHDSARKKKDRRKKMPDVLALLIGEREREREGSRAGVGGLTKWVGKKRNGSGREDFGPKKKTGFLKLFEL